MARRDPPTGRAGVRLALAALLLSGSLVPVAANAHHSFSMFDRREGSKKALTGVVTRFALVNPHASLQLKAIDPSGRETVWTFEMAGVASLTHAGWQAGTVRAGQRITVTYFPLRFGSFGGQLIEARLADGRTLAALAEADRGYPKN